MTEDRFAVILTHNRHELLWRCVHAIVSQVDYVIIVDNASDPPVSLHKHIDPDDLADGIFALKRVSEQPPNLARFMNVGFDRADVLRDTDRWTVAVVCDDVVVPDDWFASVARHLRVNGVVAGSTHQVHPVTQPLVKTVPDYDIYNRMQGSAYVIAGEVGLRADERMHWWWQDTDMDWQARRAGGMVIAPGPVAYNTRPNEFTNSRPELAQRAGLDAAAFREKWGFQPW